MSEKQPLGKCKKHPRYLYKNPPRATNLYPKGCPKCWELYEESERLKREREAEEYAKAKAEVPVPGKPFEVGNTLGKGGSVPKKTVPEYVRAKTANGKKIVDAMMKIAGIHPRVSGQDVNEKRASVKDQQAALKELYNMSQADQQEDRPQDIRVIVLDLKGMNFAEYQKHRNSS